MTDATGAGVYEPSNGLAAAAFLTYLSRSATASSATTQASTPSNQNKTRRVCRFYNTKNGRPSHSSSPWTYNSQRRTFLNFRISFLSSEYDPSSILTIFQAAELGKSADFYILRQTRAKQIPHRMREEDRLQLPPNLDLHTTPVHHLQLYQESLLGLFPKLRPMIQELSRSARYNGDSSPRYQSKMARLLWLSP